MPVRHELAVCQANPVALHVAAPSPLWWLPSRSLWRSLARERLGLLRSGFRLRGRARRRLCSCLCFLLAPDLGLRLCRDGTRGRAFLELDDEHADLLVAVVLGRARERREPHGLSRLEIHF